MDLLEIRKKAKEKEGKEAAQPVAEAPEAAPAEASPEVPPGNEKRKRRKRQPIKKTVEASAGPVFHEPELAAGPGEMPEEIVEEAPAEPPVEPPSPPAIQEKLTDAPAATDETAPAQEQYDNIVEYLAFMLANEEYAVKVEDVKEIIRGQSITTVPRTPGFVLGIISLRGVILPVFDIKKRLGLEGGGSKKTSRIVVVADKSGLQGIMVDKVTGVVRIKESAVEPPPAIIGGVEAEYLEGLGRIGERLLILFNTDKVLTVG